MFEYEHRPYLERRALHIWWRHKYAGTIKVYADESRRICVTWMGLSQVGGDGAVSLTCPETVSAAKRSAATTCTHSALHFTEYAQDRSSGRGRFYGFKPPPPKLWKKSWPVLSQSFSLLASENQWRCTALVTCALKCTISKQKFQNNFQPPPVSDIRSRLWPSATRSSALPSHWTSSPKIKFLVTALGTRSMNPRSGRSKIFHVDRYPLINPVRSFWI